MKKIVVVLLDTLHALALAIWLGGLVVLTLLVAPVLFQGTALADADAREVYGALLGKFVAWASACGATMFVVQFLLRRRYEKSQTLSVIDDARQVLTFGALLLTYMYLGNLLPGLKTTRRVGELSHVLKFEGSYALIAVSQAGALLLIAALTVYLSLPASGGSSRRANTEEAESGSPPPSRRKRRR